MPREAVDLGHMIMHTLSHKLHALFWHKQKIKQNVLLNDIFDVWVILVSLNMKGQMHIT